MNKKIVILLMSSLLLSLNLYADVDSNTSLNKEESVLESIDTFFGKVLVAPLASVFFFDVIYWDNEISGEQLVGKQSPKGFIQNFDPEKGYQIRQEDTVKSLADTDVEVILEEGQTYNFGSIVTVIKKDNDKIFADVAATRLNVREYAVGDYSRWAGPEFVFLDHNGTVVERKLNSSVKIVQGVAPFTLIGTLSGDVFSTFRIRVPLHKKDMLGLSNIKTVAIGTKIFKVLNHDRYNKTFQVQAYKENSDIWIPTKELSAVKNPDDIALPLVVIWLLMGAVFFTFRMGFINVRAFKHAVAVIKGDYDDPSDPGEISHFQALASALSATVGLGNIAGVAIAMSQGGPGALFWMIIAAFFGMTSKFVECSLGQMYRHVDDNGTVSGGPMRYLKAGLAEINLKPLGLILSFMFSLLCIGGSFGGGGMFQSNQAFQAIAQQFPMIKNYDWLFGMVLAILVGIVIIGGIKRIGVIAGYIVPFMAVFYIAAVIWMLLVNIDKVPYAFMTIIRQAFNPEAMYGGAIGVLLIGFRRAAFSNEAGVGSAAIAHSAAATKEPIREGIVAMIGPFIDTIVICTMTGLAVIITGVYQSTDGNNDGVLMVFNAFESTFGALSILFPVLVFFFAFSTMISWSYYGERCFVLIFGEKSSAIYKFLYLFFVFIGVVITLKNVVDFSDLMILGMAFPNILGALLLSSKVRTRLDEYWQRYKGGDMLRYKS